MPPKEKSSGAKKKSKGDGKSSGGKKKGDKKDGKKKDKSKKKKKAVQEYEDLPPPTFIQKVINCFLCRKPRPPRKLVKELTKKQMLNMKVFKAAPKAIYVEEEAPLWSPKDLAALKIQHLLMRVYSKKLVRDKFNKVMKKANLFWSGKCC